MNRGLTHALGAAFVLLICVAPAGAQSISVTLLPGAVAFTLANNSATNTGSTSIAVTTSWTLLSTGRTISVYAYFSSAAAALAHTAGSNTTDIPSSRVEVSINGAAKVPFDQSAPFGAVGAGRLLVTQVVTALTGSSLRTDTLALNINLNSYPVPADTYSGMLRVRAQVSP